MTGFYGERAAPFADADRSRAARRLEVMSEDACWARIRGHDLGRLGIVVGGRPRIFPVNYATADGTVVFRSEAGSKVDHARGSAACFEIDGWNERSASGWSVMAAGTLEEITGDDERSRGLRGLPVHPAAPGERSHWLALTVEEVSGRSFHGGWTLPGRYLG